MTRWEVLYNFGIFSGIGAFVFFLARSLFLHMLSKDTERFKAGLQLESLREMENLKSTLSLASYEHQVRFSRLYEKRANIIEKTHINIFNLQKEASRFVGLFLANEEFTRENREKLWQAADKFVSDFGGKYISIRRLRQNNEFKKKYSRQFPHCLLG
jgi:hypothetical protein